MESSVQKRHSPPLQPCDKDYALVAEDESYATYCHDQQIDSDHTLYTWFISTPDEPLVYHAVDRATIFTAFDGKVLEPVYLNRSVNVRCQAQAVTGLGTQGGSRTSESVHLSRSVLLSPGTCDSVSSFSELYKSDGFTGHPEVRGTCTIIECVCASSTNKTQ